MPLVSSVNKNETFGVRKQKLKIDKGKHLQLSKNDYAYIERRTVTRLFRQFFFLVTMKVFEEESVNFSSYIEEYLICRREIYLPVDSIYS